MSRRTAALMLTLVCLVAMPAGAATVVYAYDQSPTFYLAEGTTNPGFDDETLRNQLSALSSLLQSLLPAWAVFDVDPLGYVL